MSVLARIGVRVRRVRVTRVLRRVHMYAGLLMLPWVLLFGLSGILFNHPNLGEEVVGRPVPADELGRAGIAPWDARQIAERVLERVHADGQPALRLDPDHSAELTGFTVLSAPSPQGQHMLLLDMQEARGVLVSRTARRAPEGSTFPKRQVPLADVSTKAVEQSLGGLLEARQLTSLGPLRAHPKIAPELRFVVRDADDAQWNLTYDLGSGTLSGRKRDVLPNVGRRSCSAAARTHTSAAFGVLWLWALSPTCSASHVSGLVRMIMWWQLKPRACRRRVALHRTRSRGAGHRRPARTLPWRRHGRPRPWAEVRPAPRVRSQAPRVAPPSTTRSCTCLSRPLGEQNTTASTTSSTSAMR